jgi:3-oxoadipate enol-lactonase
MGLTMASWDDVLPAFASTHRVLRYDLRGHGLTEKVTYLYTFGDLAEDLRALLDALNITEPVTLIGGAIGGATAITFAAKYPQRVKALVAYSPATGETDATREREQELNDNILKAGVRPSVLAGEDTEYKKEIRTPARYARYRGMKLANDLHGWVAARNMAVATDADAFVKQYAAIQCPTLIMASAFPGGKRPAAQVKAEVADRIAGAKFMAIESGHYMALERPDLLAPAVVNFLQSVGGNA